MKDEVEEKAETKPAPSRRRRSNRVKTIKAKGVFYEISLEAGLELINFIRVFGMSDEAAERFAHEYRLLFNGCRTYRNTEKTRALAMEADRAAEDEMEAESEPSKPRPKGGRRGRNGFKSYPASTILVTHPVLEVGSSCPCGCGGRLRPLKKRRSLRIRAQCPLEAKVYEQEGLRCSLCQEVFRAPLPGEAGREKYDVSVASSIAVLKYGSGMPFHRQAVWYAMSGFPMAVATQYALVADGVEALAPIYEELRQVSAQSDEICSDDTKGRILSVERTGEFAKRSGVHTTGTVAKVGDHKIAFFETGVRHAGENLDLLLEKRLNQSAVATIMTDALSRNSPKHRLKEGLKLIIANCLAHGRRNFVDIINSFPDECFHVLTNLGKVYYYDKQAQIQGLDATARLQFHQLRSAPVMDSLREWMQAQLDNEKTEPNSRLGKAMNYMLSRWDKLTVFLKIPGASLDNNVVERALKKAVLHRKNSLFYRTENGARVGDIYMSVIYTCQLNGVNPFEYLNSFPPPK